MDTPPIIQSPLPPATSKKNGCAILSVCAIVFLVLIIVLGFIFGATDRKGSQNIASQKVEQREEVIETNAWQIAADYTRNEIAGDNRYKGRLVRVQGRVTHIGKDFLGSPFVVLEGEETFRNVQCYIRKEFVERAASLEPGQIVVITGRVDGLMMNVLVKDAVLELNGH